MGVVINEAMLGFQFDAEDANEMSEKLSKEILHKVKNLNFDRLVLLLLNFAYHHCICLLIVRFRSFLLDTNSCVS